MNRIEKMHLTLTSITSQVIATCSAIKQLTVTGKQTQIQMNVKINQRNLQTSEMRESLSYPATETLRRKARVVTYRSKFSKAEEAPLAAPEPPPPLL